MAKLHQVSANNLVHCQHRGKLYTLLHLDIGHVADMSWSSEDEQFEKVKQPKGRSRSQTREVNEGSQVPTSVVAGLAAVGLTIFGIGVRYLLKQNAPPEPKKKKAAQRKKPPPRRPRSAASSKQGR